MSGICAVWQKNNPRGAGEALAAIAGGLAVSESRTHTGKMDGDAGVAVCSRFATQQIHETPALLVACDADILNEAGLRRQLGIAAENSTAALLAAAYEKFGPAFVEQLRGSFSIVLWNRHERSLFAAIDGFGINRLVYYEDARMLAVATRIDALTRAAGVDRTISPRAVANVLNFTANLGPETIFKRVQRLTPGTRLIGSQAQTRLESYWDMRYHTGRTRDSEQQLSRRLESLVQDAVSTHCRDEAFGELGAFLSGGTDSSTVVGMMSRMNKGPVKAFSIGFEEERFNELEYAKLAADTFKAEHHTYLVGARECLGAIPAIVAAFDEPFGNSSAIPTFFCTRLAAQNGVKAILAGDGGDELFGGNERYRTDKVFAAYQNVPYAIRKGIVEPALRLLPVDNGPVGRARRYVRRSNIPAVERFFSYHFLCANSPADILHADFLSMLDGYSVLSTPSAHYHNAPASDHLDRMLYVDVKITLADNDLPKVTCMSELSGVRPRFPFLDRAVAEFSASIPASLKVKGLEKRYLFKRAFRELLPPEIIRKKKHGFGIPVASWMRSDPAFRELSRDTLLSRRAAQRGYFRNGFVQDLFDKNDADDSSYYGDTLWTLLALELWHLRFMDTPLAVAS